NVLTKKGLTTRPNKLTAPHPVYLSKFHLLLQNPYYKGIVSYRDVDYQGRHEPLVTPEVWEQVQTVLAAHRNGEKQRRHNHYLRSSLFCGFCDGRMCFINARGKSGKHFPYYFCLNRQQRRGCNQPFVPLALIEKEIERIYQRIQLSKIEAEELREVVRAS